MKASDYDPERSWRKSEPPAHSKDTGLRTAELALDVLDMIFDILDAIF